MNESGFPGGFLIAIEGIDGAGKTTLAQSLLRHVREVLDLPASASKEPTQGPFGAALRATAATGRLTPDEELRLLLLDRQEHVRQLIAPSLTNGVVVILDRYYLSNMAYQGAEGIDPAAIESDNLAFAPEPDLVLLLDAEVSIGLERIRARGDFANKFETPETLVRARKIFLDFLPEPPIGAVIDASMSAAEVHEEAIGHIVFAMADKLRRTGGVSIETLDRVIRIMPAQMLRA